jgi:hypothetical protein
MGWNPFKEAEKVVEKAKDKVEDLGKKAEKLAKEVYEEGEKAVNKIAEAAKDATNPIVDEVDHITGVNLKPIVKAIAGPTHILVKIAEGQNVGDATTDWVVNQIEGSGEIAGILGEDVEKIVETIVSYANVPVLVLANYGSDSLEVVEGDEEFEDLLGTPLKSLISKAHALYDKHAKPIPFELKMVLRDVVDSNALNRARWVIDRTPNNVAGLANALNHEPHEHIHAVTLDDIIVFSGNPNPNLAGYLLWVHELEHVEQYAKWGVLEFAANYTKDYKEVEAEAVAAEAVAKPILEKLMKELT